METAWLLLPYLGCFLAGLIAGAILLASIRRARAPAVYKLLRDHFAPTALSAVRVTERQFPARVRVDLHRTMDQVLRERVSVEQVCGIRMTQETLMMFGISLSELLSQATEAALVPLEYEEVDIGEEEPIRCLRNALWLLTCRGNKCAVLLSQVFQFNEAPKVRLDVASPDNPVGTSFSREFFKGLEDAVRKADSYRGKVLSLESTEEYTGEATGIKVHKVPTVAREEVILPEATLETLKRNVIQFAGQRKTLAELGHSAKKGLLFHGPPGNGKTHTIHYLIGELEGHTTLLISAEQVAQLHEYMALARLLQPTLVVLEDVDLIGRERTQAESPCREALLNRLLNEMDGLKEDAEIFFLLTSNRPEDLEDALACRPGRVDQAIEFPLPDEKGREKLLQLYSRGVKVPRELVEVIAQRTKDVSAAFIKELMRRALQFHLGRSESPDIDLEDIENALQELLVTGGRLSQRVLGVGNDDAPVPRHTKTPGLPGERCDLR